MNSKRQILMLGTSFDTMGGIAAVIREYRDAGLFERFPVIYLATHCDGSLLKKLRICVSSWLRYMWLLACCEVEMIHVHVASDFSFWRKTLFLFPAFLFGKSSILHLHGAGFAMFYEERCNRLSKWLVRYVFDHVDSIVVLSPQWQSWVKSISRNSRIRIIGNPVKLPVPLAIHHRASASILCLGRLGDRKGTYDLLSAISRLVKNYPDVKLILAGDGELLRARAEANKLGISMNVSILGWVSGADKTQLQMDAAIYALPSYAEGLPMSVLEAMAAGLPVVSTPVGGIPELITSGVEGYLVQPGDIEALTDALARLLADKGLRHRMGEAAKIKAESQFSHERVLPQIAQLYQELGIHA